MLIDDSARFDGVRALEVDEHVWRQAWLGDGYIIVIIDLRPIRDGAGSVRLLGHGESVEGRSRQAFKGWFVSRPRKGRRDGAGTKPTRCER